MTNSNANKKVALVTGAADDIGESVALALAGQGVSLALCDTDSERLQGLKQKIAKSGGEAIVVPLARPTANAVNEAVDAVLSHFKKIDILISHTAEPAAEPLTTISSNDLSATLDGVLGLQSHWLHRVLPVMRSNGYGRVVSIGSLAYLGMAKGANLAAAQAGLFGLVRSAALEAARDGVTVNSVVKGNLTSPAMTEEQSLAVANGIPVKRLGTPADITHAVTFFASETAKYVTGQTLFVCGGKSVYYSMSV